MPPRDAPSALATELLEALRPLSDRLAAVRTLSAGKIGILRQLAIRGRATTSDLAGEVRVSQQAVSLAARELEELGYLARSPDPDDRRRTWLSLSEAGHRRLADELAAGSSWLAAAIEDSLTAAQRRELAAAVPALRALGRANADD
ncbi:MarR family winged helix-turn-helix transcriptional regulator [Microbacterium caowuchunii]|uniref:MarR family transcriptional regulator n=1 Tax=Microbacterium caowuchunii TaxID=2614638 RepID=A0A5N0TLB5_9MICO|nr:MarR family transcriptional regulator [Microbacterium caowuchunii]KAA9135792.1 MarR family transcriptional regulator [Microbacterium caowuchunii]